jgi:DNA-binding MarR family transcriptional regulator
MRSLALLGPLTGPQIAQMRPTSCQRMQRLANELAAEGLVEFIDNPKHRRSKLVRLTPKGDARYRESTPVTVNRIHHGRRYQRTGYPQDDRDRAASER